MVDFVDVFVKRAPVEGAMRPIMPCIFKNEKYCNLVGYGEEGGERDAGCKAKVHGHWVE